MLTRFIVQPGTAPQAVPLVTSLLIVFFALGIDTPVPKRTFTALSDIAVPN